MWHHRTTITQQRAIYHTLCCTIEYGGESLHRVMCFYYGLGTSLQVCFILQIGSVVDLCAKIKYMCTPINEQEPK